MHQSAGREQGSAVFWDDVNVVLLGTLDKDGLAEYLQGPRFEIEVHDRDRKLEQKKPKPSLFGENPDDEMINNVSLVAGKSYREAITTYIIMFTPFPSANTVKPRIKEQVD